jgi:cation:H+ antiporter
MLIVIASIIAGLGLLATGAEALVRGSTSIALRLGVTPLVIGLTVVAFGTGSPELFISVEAALAGNSGIALGNVIGSNISNIALILGIAALIRPMQVRSRLILREMPLMIAVTLLLCGLLYDGALSRIEGIILLAGAAAYTLFAYISARKDRDPAVAEEFDEGIREIARPRWLDWLFVGAGFAGLLIGAKLLLGGATTVAEGLGVSQVVIGLTIVAIGTSLPELATSAVAAYRGEADVAFGNVIGSNILNILCILGAAAVIRPFAVEGLRAADLVVFMLSAVLLLPLMWRGAILNRWEGALLLAGYVFYLYSLVP